MVLFKGKIMCLWLIVTMKNLPSVIMFLKFWLQTNPSYVADAFVSEI